MTIMNGTRWHHAWYLLSLERTRPFFRDLGLAFAEETQFIIELRTVIKSAVSSPWYRRYPSILQYQVGEWFLRTYGTQAFAGILTWGSSVLVTQGSDRTAEGRWSRLVFAMTEPRLDIGEENQQKLKSLTSVLRAENERLEKRVAAGLQASDSGWDQQLLLPKELEGSVASNLVRLTGYYNNFVVAWERVWSEAGLNTLVQLYESGRRIVAEQGGDEETLAFPGNWSWLGGIIEVSAPK
jgi:hypothetical protein